MCVSLNLAPELVSRQCNTLAVCLTQNFSENSHGWSLNLRQKTQISGRVNDSSLLCTLNTHVLTEYYGFVRHQGKLGVLHW